MYFLRKFQHKFCKKWPWKNFTITVPSETYLSQYLCIIDNVIFSGTFLRFSQGFYLPKNYIQERNLYIIDTGETFFHFFAAAEERFCILKE